MSITRNDNWSIQETKIATLGSAFSSEVRVRILNILLNEKSLTTTDLCKRLNRSHSTISDHLVFLKNAELIQKDYSIHNFPISIVKSIENLINSFLKS